MSWAKPKPMSNDSSESWPFFQYFQMVFFDTHARCQSTRAGNAGRGVAGCGLVGKKQLRMKLDVAPIRNAHVRGCCVL